MAITQPGAKSNKPGRGVAEDEGEESDEYEVPEEDDEEEEERDSDDDSGDEDEQGGGLTAMLLGENTTEAGNYDEDEGWVPAGGKEPADYSGEEDEDENENHRNEPAGPSPTEKSPKSWNGGASSGGKKRARENDPGDESQEKKLKLPTDSRH